MKTKFFLLALLICGVWACSNNDDPKGEIPFLNSRLSADVNDERFESVTVSDSIEGIVGGATLTIRGTNATNDQIAVYVAFDDLGTYDISTSPVEFFYTDGSTSEQYALFNPNQNGTGSVTIISDDGEEIKGTFSFEAFSTSNPSESVTVTNGEFTAEYFFPDN